MRIKKEQITILALIFLILYLFPQDFVGAFMLSYHVPIPLLKIHFYLGEMILFGLTIGIVLKKIPILIRKRYLTLLFLLVCCFIFYYCISPQALSFTAVKELRSLVLPISALIIGFSFLDTDAHIAFFTHFLIVFALILGAWGIYEVFFVDNSFFLNHVNFSRYLNVMKGYPTEGAALGIDGSMWGREGFRDILPRRLSSVFGDSAGYPLGVSAVSIICLHFFIRNKKYHLFGIYCLIMTAVVLSFTRSGYIFVCVISFTYIFYSKLNTFFKVILFLIVITGIISVVFILKDFLLLMVQIIQNPGNNAHFLDLVGFYTTTLKDVNNLIGRGVGNGIWAESGLTILISQTGLPGFLLFFLFLLSTFLYLNKGFKQCASLFSLYDEVFILLAMGIIISIPLIMHFYAYVFALTSFYLNWLIIGCALRIVSNKRKQLFLENAVRSTYATTTIHPTH